MKWLMDPLGTNLLVENLEKFQIFFLEEVEKEKESLLS
jgi:hypothetical protein